MILAKVLEMLVAHPDPVGLRVLQLLNAAMAVRLASAENRGEGLRYSKFASGGGGFSKGADRGTISSKCGMAIIYAPAAVVCSVFLLSKLSMTSPAPFSQPFIAPCDRRLLVFAAALTLHFCKRLLEVIFLHRYSGSMGRSVSFTIAIGYFMGSSSLLYAQQRSLQEQPASLDLMRWGVCVYLVGIGGNLYHHYLLATLRASKKMDDSKGQVYVIPQGGLFPWVVCPHYLCECMDFLGLALIGQTSTAFVNALSTMILLSARSQATRRWYHEKIEDFPRERKALIPFLF